MRSFVASVVLVIYGIVANLALVYSSLINARSNLYVILGF